MARYNRKIFWEEIKTEPEIYDWWDLAELFLLERKKVNAPATVKTHRTYLSIFFKRYPKAFTDRKILNECAVDYLQVKNKSVYNLRLQSLRMFFDYLMAKEHIPENPLKGIKRKKNKKTVKEIDIDKVRKFINAFDTNTFVGFRNQVYCMFVLDTAIRPSETLQLLITDLDFADNSIIIRNTISKTRERRKGYFSPNVGELIQRLLSLRDPEWGDDVPIFCSVDGLVIKPNAIQQCLRRHGLQCGIKVSPYLLRHTSATTFLRNGGNAIALKEKMGHSDIKTTEMYVHMTEKDFKEQHMQYSAINNITLKVKKNNKAFRLA